MELPRRADGDILLAPGEMTDIRRRLRAISSQHDLATVIACAFDHRTRILPFIYADTRMAPAGVRAIGSAMVDSGFDKTRIVLQQWNRNFRPQQMRLDGRVPDIFMVSSMHLHSTRCDELIQDANQIDAESPPLDHCGRSPSHLLPVGGLRRRPRSPLGSRCGGYGRRIRLVESAGSPPVVARNQRVHAIDFPAGSRQWCAGRDSRLGLQPFYGAQRRPRGTSGHGRPALAGRSRRIAARHARLPSAGTAQHQADPGTTRFGGEPCPRPLPRCRPLC